MRLTTRVTASGIRAVYAGRVRIGYVLPRDDSRVPWMWELHMRSEQWRGHPCGVATTREAALEEIDRWLSAWMDAAGMEWKR